MTKMNWILLAFLFGFVLTWLGHNCWLNWRDPHIHCFPAVTRCPICDKRIYVWQAHERRPFNMESDNSTGLAIAVSGSGLFHTACQGTVTRTIKVTATPAGSPEGEDL